MTIKEKLQDSTENLNVRKFDKGKFENPRFWSRFKREIPQFEGKNILEIGCGWGSLAVDIALNGALRVVGLDIECELINFANDNLNKNFPQIKNTLKFQCLDLKYYDENEIFDIIVSKDSFEHILDLKGMLNEMKKRLKPGGKIYAGFGPLYTSPYGDHDRRKVILKPLGIIGKILTVLPWAHLFIEPTLIRMNNRYREREITYMRDLQLNTYSFSDYLRIFSESGFKTVLLNKNMSSSVFSRILTSLSVIPIIQNFTIHNVYCILEKPIE